MQIDLSDKCKRHIGNCILENYPDVPTYFTQLLAGVWDISAQIFSVYLCKRRFAQYLEVVIVNNILGNVDQVIIEKVP